MKKLLFILILGISILASCSGLPEWTYPEVNQLNAYEANSPYQEWEGIENSAWDPVALEAKVTELAWEHKIENPFAPGHVCWDMSVELWQVFEDNSITSFIAVKKSETIDWAGTHEAVSHVWLIVLHEDDLSLGVECVAGVVYSPNYLRPYELECEQAYSNYGISSSEWDIEKAAYDWAYGEYEQHLEGYFYRDPNALKEVLLSY